jgi:hypothetical protein
MVCDAGVLITGNNWVNQMIGAQQEVVVVPAPVAPRVTPDAAGSSSSGARSTDDGSAGGHVSGVESSAMGTFKEDERDALKEIRLAEVENTELENGSSDESKEAGDSDIVKE